MMDLYQAILARRSVRRYYPALLDKAMLARVDEIMDSVKSLVPANRLRLMRRDVFTGEDLIMAMGGYGRVISPPHYLVGSIAGETHLLTDMGFRMQQIAVQMTQLGIGMCFIGSLGRERSVRVRFRLPPETRTGAFLIFGRPAENVGGRTINAVMRRTAGATSKLPARSLFFNGAFDEPTAPPKSLSKLIEAARNAPSANNAQPWRFLWYDDELYVFVRRQNLKYGNKPGVDEYRFFDGGICMSNIMMTLETLGRQGHWTLLYGPEPNIPDYPPTLQPLAKLTLM
jgi:nitroreductase